MDKPAQDIRAVCTLGGRSTNLELPTRSRENFAIAMYHDSMGNDRWRMVDKRNNKIVDASTQGFSNEKTCVVNCYLSTGFLPDGWQLQ